MTQKKVVIVGGGFGGLNAAKALGSRTDIEITMIDRRNHHLFQPLLYQVAMAGLSPAEISFPIRSILSRYPRTSVVMGEVTEIQTDNKKLITTIGELSYDYLILAAGAEHSYFGHDEWEDFAPGLKTLEQATEIRRRVLTAFERAEISKSEEEISSLLTFVIIGGGPTGVELAGAIGEITHHTLSNDFRHIDPNRTRILLLEAGPCLLPSFPDSLSARALEDLKELGVEVKLHCKVTNVSQTSVQFGEEQVKTQTVIWAAGVKPSPLNQSLKCPLDKLGRVIVTEGLCLPTRSEVFVIGDQAHTPGTDGKPLPGLAPVAMQQGRFVASQIAKDLENGQRQSFHYLDKGQMATIGRRRAVAVTGSLKLKGLIAWLAWLMIHIYYLIGFKNRIFVLWTWTYSYLTYRRGARLITKRDWHSKN